MSALTSGAWPFPTGAVTASDGKTSLTVRDGGRAFRRRAVRCSGEQAEWLVGELDGVRVYVDGDHVVLTREDLNP